MRDYGPLYNVITGEWFQDEPNRIVWFTKLLNAADDDGVIAMSRAKYGRMFNCTAKAAFYYLNHLEQTGIVKIAADTNSTTITICDFNDYDISGRNLGAERAQVNNCSTNSYEEQWRNLGAERAQEARKENRKETPLSPTPPITKEKIKEKKTLTLSSAPDFVGDGFTASAKDLEKHKAAEERKAKAAEKKQKELTLVHKARGIFETVYNELYEDSNYWTAKDAVAMKRLIKKITFARTNRAKPLPCDDESLLEALKTFLTLINKSWIMNNFSVTKIDSQYNDIVSEIKNEKNKQKNSANGNRTQTIQTSSAALLASQAANILNDIAKADELYYRGEQGGNDAT